MKFRYDPTGSWRFDPTPSAAKDGCALGQVKRYALEGLLMSRCPACGGVIVFRGEVVRADPLTVEAQTGSIRCLCSRCQCSWNVKEGRGKLVSEPIERIEA
jgi:hypothetical protein